MSVPRLWLLWLLLLVCGLAQAQVDSVAATVEANRVILRAQYIGPNYTVGKNAALTGVEVGRTFMMPSPVGNVAARAAVSVGASDAAVLGARALKFALNPYLGAAVLAGGLYLDYRVRQKAEGGALEVDAGVAPGSSTVSGYYYPAAVLGCLGGSCTGAPSTTASTPAGVRYASPSEACSAIQFVSTGGNGTWGAALSTGFANNGCYARQYPAAGNCNTTCLGFGPLGASNGSTSVPSCSVGVIGRDGKCASGTYAPIEPDAAAQLPITYPPGLTVQQYEDLVREALGVLEPQSVAGLPTAAFALNVLDSTPSTGLPAVNGNYPVLGDQTLVTNPDGSTRTDSITWNFARVADSIRDTESGKWSSTTKTTTTTAGGATSVTTTTATPGVLPGQGTVTSPAPDGQAEANPCVSNPGSLGCVELGTPPTDAPAVTTQAIDFQVDALGLPAACPAPLEQTFPVVGLVAMPWTPLCDIAGSIRLAFLACASLAAAGVIVFATTR